MVLTIPHATDVAVPLSFSDGSDEIRLPCKCQGPRYPQTHRERDSLTHTHEVQNKQPNVPVAYDIVYMNAVSPETLYCQNDPTTETRCPKHA